MPTWKIFFDLQCPYSKKCWENLPAIRERFENKQEQHQDSYEITTHITSLAFHPQAFTAQCAATLIGNLKGAATRQKFEDACFQQQDSFMNKALGDCTKSQVDEVFYKIAENANCGVSKEEFMAGLHDWEKAVKPAYTEHKVALQYGVYGTPKHVINEKLVPDTESAWGPDEWAEKLKSL